MRMPPKKKCDGRPCKEGANAFLRAGFDRSDEQRVLIYWTTEIRPVLGERFRNMPLHGLGRDFLDVVEDRLMNRLRSEREDREERAAWMAAKFSHPRYLGDFLMRWLNLMTSPRWVPDLRQPILDRLALPDWIDETANGPTPLEDILRLYATGLKSARQRKALLERTSEAAAILEEQGVTFDLAVMALRREAVGKRGPAPSELHFCTEKGFYFYVLTIYRNVLNDWWRQGGQREKPTDLSDQATREMQAEFEARFESLEQDDLEDDPSDDDELDGDELDD